MYGIGGKGGGYSETNGHVYMTSSGAQNAIYMRSSEIVAVPLICGKLQYPFFHNELIKTFFYISIHH